MKYKSRNHIRKSYKEIKEALLFLTGFAVEDLPQEDAQEGRNRQC